MLNKAIHRTYQICTIDKHLDCSSCNIAANVDCSRYKPEQMVQYYRMIAIYVIPGILILGMATFILHWWWVLPGYILYWIIYQITGELFIRCRHCPFWDESNPRLDCRINCGVTKLQWLTPKSLVRYHPGPLKSWEKFVVQALSFGTILFPLAVAVIVMIKQAPLFGYTNMSAWITIVLFISQIFTGIYFIRYLTGRLCPTCVHFSCPNNHQPYHVIERYLARNEIIRSAWEKDLHRYSSRK